MRRNHDFRNVLLDLDLAVLYLFCFADVSVGLVNVEGY